MILQPLKSFLIDYKLNNPSDTDTLYVQAVVKAAVSGTTLANINLTDNGSHYFSYLWTTPADQSGTGLQITITKTVYTDSGYTTESLVYGTTVETYIVRELAGIRGVGAASGVGGMGGVDYSKLEKLIRQIVSEIPKIEIPKQDDTLADRIESVKETVLNQLVKYDKEDSEHMNLIEANVKKSVESGVGKILSSKELGAISELPGQFQDAETSDDELHDFVTRTHEEVKKEVGELKLFVYKSIEDLKQTITEALDKPVQIEVGNIGKATRPVEQPSPHAGTIANLMGI